METYKFEIDRKLTIWCKEFHEIKATNYDEARRMMIRNFRQDASDNTFTWQELQDETINNLYVDGNGGWPTAVLLDADGNELADNTIMDSITIKN
jgi:hypothetical protein